MPLLQPPDLSSHADLSIGDVYINIVRGQTKAEQLWIWTAGGDDGLFWKRALRGDVREDGRRLTITPKRRDPLWVGNNWAVKRLRINQVV